MNYKTLNADISAAAFRGLSMSYQRKVAFIATIFIWFGISFTGLDLANQYADSQSVTDIAIILFFGMVAH